MEININEEEYEALTKALYLASAVLKSYRPDVMEEDLLQEILLEKLLKRAREFDLEHWVRVEKNGQTLLQEEKEFEFFEAIETFETLSFWNQLSQNLAQRDLEEVLSDQDLLNMSIGDEMEKEAEIQEKYEEEFIENGLQNLRLINPGHN